MMPHTEKPRLATLVILTGMSMLSLNMFVPSLATMAAEFGTDYPTISIAVAGYLAATAAVQIIVGSLSDRIGRRPVVLGTLVVFTVASVGCAASDNVWIFLFFRLLQSAIASSYVLSVTMVRDTSSQQETASLIGYISMAMAVAPMLGPVLGGILDSILGWRSTFYFYVLAGLVLLTFCAVDLRETLPPRSEDVKPGSKSVMALLLDTRFWGYSLCSAFSTGAYFVFIAGAPFVAANVFSVPPVGLGIYVGSITLGYMIGAFMTSRFARKYDILPIMLAGRIVGCVGLLVGIGSVLLGADSAFIYFGCTVFVGLGNGITVPGSNAGVVSVRPDQSGRAAGLGGAVTVVLGSILTMTTGVLVSGSFAALMLLSIMLLSTFLGFLSALWVFYQNRNA
ncbi:MAG: multidrug effflux MFS transporter [Pseudomonadota bacterium]